VENFFKDIRYGIRSLLKHPGFTAIAVITLALGIGANTAIFSVVNALILRPLPYRNADQLVWISEASPLTNGEMVPGPHFLEWNEQSQTLAQVAAYNPDNLTLTGTGEPERLDCNRVSAEFFSVLGVQPLLGRNFLPAEDRSGGDRVVIIAHSLWQRRFSADQKIVGQSITLDDQSYSVVGVLPPDFRFFQKFELWVPLALNPQQERGNQQISSLSAIARLKPGVTIRQTQTELETRRLRFENSKPSNTPRFDGQVRVVSLHEKLVGPTRRLLAILFGAVGVILLIACANVANLLLSRAVVRQKEFAIRAGLGAGRRRLMQQMLTESLLLALVGGMLGVLLAFWLAEALMTLAAANTFGEISRLATVNIDIRVLGFALLVSFLTGALFGLAPAFQLSRPELNDLLKEGWRGSGFHRGRVRHLLMVTEVALSIVLLVGAGLLIRSFINLLEINPGFKAEHLLTARLSLPYPRYQDRARRQQFVEQLLPRISALPGVESAGAINHLPLTDFLFTGWLRVEGQAEAINRNEAGIPISQITPGYFRAMSIPLRSGRNFTEHDDADAPRVVILNETLARKLFFGQEPIGRRVWVPGPGKGMPIVVGVVGDVRHEGLDRDVRPEVYVPYTQNPSGFMTLVIRSKVDPLSLGAAVRKEVLALDSSLPVYQVMTMDQRLSESFASRRFNLLLLGVFAFLALTLAAVGVYGVIAYGVTQRTHEIGIRMALGARGGDVLRLLMRQGMSLVALGVVLGLAGAWALTRVMTNLLFGVTPTDATTFASVAALLIVVALLACYIPARRATKVDPLVALRYE